MAILTKGLYEYEIYKNEIRICMLRSVGLISNNKNKARAIPAGPALEIPKAQLIQTIKEEFAILFSNPKNILNELDKFNENYAAIDGEFKREMKLKLAKKEKDEYIYGINGNKIIYYNLQKGEISIK